jgi:single-strand DNA-binding protein
MRTVVDGTLQVRSWKDNNGNNRKAVEVVAEHVYFADNKRTSGNDEQSSQPAKDPLGQDFRDLGDMDDGELPF